MHIFKKHQNIVFTTSNHSFQLQLQAENSRSHLNFIAGLCLELCIEWHSGYDVQTTQLFVYPTLEKLFVVHQLGDIKASFFQHLVSNQ